MPLDVITTVRRATTTVTEHHQRKIRPFNHTKALKHPNKVSLLDLPQVLIPPAMLDPEAALTPSHRVVEKTTTVADENQKAQKPLSNLRQQLSKFGAEHYTHNRFKFNFLS